MSFSLNHCGEGCYALLFHGDHIGAAFAQQGQFDEEWIAVIRDGWTASNGDLPHPFTRREHSFPSLQDLQKWLRLPLGVEADAETNARATSG